MNHTNSNNAISITNVIQFETILKILVVVLKMFNKMCIPVQQKVLCVYIFHINTFINTFKLYTFILLNL